MKYLKTVKLEAIKGDKTISQAKDLFSGYISPTFNNLNIKDNPTKAQKIDIFEIDRDGTFKDFFTQPEKQVMTQEQVIEFCKNHRDDLKQGGAANFFLLKKHNDFFVADVRVYGRGLKAHVYEFGDDYVWDAEDRNRVVFPQLGSNTLSPEKFPCDFKTLSLRILNLEDKLKKISEILT